MDNIKPSENADDLITEGVGSSLSADEIKEADNQAEVIGGLTAVAFLASSIIKASNKVDSQVVEIKNKSNSSEWNNDNSNAVTAAVSASLGAESLKLTLDVVARVAQSIGDWDNNKKGGLDLLTYKTREDDRVRPAHVELNNLTYPASHSFWSSHYPPLDYNCRCRVIASRSVDAKKDGIKISSEKPKETMVALKNKSTGKVTITPKSVNPAFISNPSLNRTLTSREYMNDQIAAVAKLSPASAQTLISKSYAYAKKSGLVTAAGKIALAATVGTITYLVLDESNKDALDEIYVDDATGEIKGVDKEKHAILEVEL